MKSLILSLSILLFSSALFAQALAVAAISQPANEAVLPTVETNTLATAAAHSKLAISQISEHLQEHLEYPEAMTELALEGTVTVAVIISNKGEIAKVSVATSDLPKVFQQDLLSCFSKLEKLQLKTGHYFGQSVVYVPVHFSL